MLPVPLNEIRLNLLGKIFFAAVGAWLVGKTVNMKIRGMPEEIQAVTNAMMASRRFQDELEREGATVESVMQKLGLKHASAREFERILGVPWPLALLLLIGLGHVALHFLSTVSA